MTRDEANKLPPRCLDEMSQEILALVAGWSNKYAMKSIFIDWLYNNNYEIVDRTLTEEEVRHLDEEIGRSMQFDNPLSGGGK